MAKTNKDEGTKKIMVTLKANVKYGENAHKAGETIEVKATDIAEFKRAGVVKEVKVITQKQPAKSGAQKKEDPNGEEKSDGKEESGDGGNKTDDNDGKVNNDGNAGQS